MKFIHTADVHLGATPDATQPWGSFRKEEIWDSLRRLVDLCNREEVELLLIAGDFFHKQPLIRELKEANYILSALKTAQVVLMAGNHDYISARSNYHEFAWDSRVHMFMEQTIEYVELPELNARVYGLSYCNRDITEALYDRVVPADKSKINLLLAHGGDERNIPMNRRMLAEAGFDYIALGHIHKPEQISNKMAYCGSLEPIDKTELGERGCIIGEIIEEKGQRSTGIRFVPMASREYKQLRLKSDENTTNGSLQDQAKELIRVTGEQHIYSFVIQGIRDEAVRYDTQAIRGLGHVLEVEDRTVPDYDFDAIYHENEENMIGLFIRRIRENASHDDVARKALYYGIEALLGAKD